MRRLAVLTAVLAGCSGAISFDEHVDAIATARCIYYERCGLVASRDHCLAFYGNMTPDNPSAGAAYDAGKLAYDGTAARACIDAFGALSCDATEQSPDDLAVCDDVLTGTLGAGEACAFNGECASDTCAIPLCNMACCIGECVAASAKPSVGEPCTALCEDGAYCNADDMCAALLPANAACNAEVCNYGLYCKGVTPTSSGTCTPYPQLGQPCENACADVNAICQGGTCIAAGVVGDACSPDAPCTMFYDCTNGACAVLPTRGMPCASYCSDASWCGPSSTCEAQEPNGSTCSRNDECQSHYCVRNGTAGTCGDVPLCF